MRIFRSRTAQAIVIMLGVLVACPAWAARPLATEDTGTLDPGGLELEIGLDYLRSGGAQLFLLPGGHALNFGVLPGLEGGVAITLVVLDPEDKAVRAGIGDSLVRFKYRFLDETPVAPALIASVVARLPTGDESRGLGARDVDVLAFAGASKTFTPVTLTMNAGYTFVTRDRALDVVNLAASAEARVSRAWSVVGEIVSELTTTRHNADRAFVRTGTVYAVHERVLFDAAVGCGLTGASPDLVLTVGVTITLR
jgi:hypothetical protein